MRLILSAIISLSLFTGCQTTKKTERIAVALCVINKEAGKLQCSGKPSLPLSDADRYIAMSPEDFALLMENFDQRLAEAKRCDL